MPLTPMMQQYLQLKEEHSDCLLFFRLGDFYELFFDDAKLASRELEITLTARNCGLDERAPMCGVPFHAVDNYVARLVGKGYKVAICEQLEEPGKGIDLVKRGIIRIVTPGTVSEGSLLEDDRNNNLVALAIQDGTYGVAGADVSTGDFSVQQVHTATELLAALSRLVPREIIFAEPDSPSFELLRLQMKDVAFNACQPYMFEMQSAERVLREHFGMGSLLGLEELPAGTIAAGALLQYLMDTQMNAVPHITRMQLVSSEQFMQLDQFTQRNLELTETLRDKAKKGSLLWLLDKTKTAMGARLIRSYIQRPLYNKREINRRLQAVSELKKDFALRSDLRDALAEIYDIERLVARISYPSFDARAALMLKRSIGQLPSVKALLAQAKSRLLRECHDQMDLMQDLFDLLDRAIDEEPPVSVKDGGIIKRGFHHEVDHLREAGKNGREWLLAMEAGERERTGIKNLKIGYNKVFGYYIEVTKSNLANVPITYLRKQTLANCERYITKELKELEDTILNAQEQCARLEYELFLKVREKLSHYIERLQQVARCVAQADVLQSLAQAAYDNDYSQPQITEDGIIEIKGGRHPVVEKTVRQEFVPNDTYLDQGENRMLVITGPNMAGKSTFMRQIGLIVIMAHIGSFVPAALARICLVDRVLTRVGASDDLASGQSTFMVEMNELAGILNSATPHSLLILDEIGRGTSTLDGLSIAWASLEYIADPARLGAKTLFATHYHELTDLEGKLPGMKNYSVGVKEFQDTVIFLHKIRRGGTDKSFGIEVARLAGLPRELLDNAKRLLGVLQEQATLSLGGIDEHVPTQQPAVLPPNVARLLQSIRSIDVNNLTPLEALSVLNDLKNQVES